MRRKYRYQFMHTYIIHIRGGKSNLGVVWPRKKDKQVYEGCRIWLGARDF